MSTHPAPSFWNWTFPGLALAALLMACRGGGEGGSTDRLVLETLSVLGVKDEFSIKGVSKEVVQTPPTPPSYQVTTWNSLLISQAQEFGGFDLGSIRSTGDFIKALYSQPSTFELRPGVSSQTSVFPTDVPNNLLYQVLRFNPTRALGMSDQVEVPLYAVDRAQRRETRLRDLPMQAAAASVFNGGHLWAAIRGDDVVCQRRRRPLPPAGPVGNGRTTQRPRRPGHRVHHDPAPAQRLSPPRQNTMGVSFPSRFTARRMGRTGPRLGTVTSTHSSSPAARTLGSGTRPGMK
ncbi:MAG: hypothetical protein P4L36_03965 [Holophaga sp.]|nr:hypothetical protein [Holophaga sp.]